ncbi:unnamed protein product, partial [Chrysoparadoxa australica]
MGLSKGVYLQYTAKYSVLGGCDGSDVKLAVLNVICPYTRRAVIQCFRKRGRAWGLTSDTSKAELQWGDYECLDWERIVSGKLRASSFCVRKGLSRKAWMSMYCNKYITKNPKSPLRHALPATVIVDTWEAFDDSLTFNFGGGDIASFGDDLGVRQSKGLSERIDWCLGEVEEKMKAMPGPWILKPSTLNKGAAVVLVADVADLRSAVHSCTDIREWVLQEYIQRPKLIGGRKFHFRAYVLAVGCLSVYFFQRVLILRALRQYDEDCRDPLAHITNTAVQAECQDFDESLAVMLLDEKVGQEKAKKGLQPVLTLASLVSSPDFQSLSFAFEQGEFSVFSPLPHCFEHFGLDFMVDESGQMWLLEANPGPDFRQTGASLGYIVDELMEESSLI